MKTHIENKLSQGTHEGFDWVVLHNGAGFRCGYICVTKDHPWFELFYDHIHAQFDFVSVHGGLTYSGYGDTQTEWWIGFDCAHGGDKIDTSLPHEHLSYIFNTGEIRTQEYVEEQCRNLCAQAKQAAKLSDPTPDSNVLAGNTSHPVPSSDANQNKEKTK